MIAHRPMRRMDDNPVDSDEEDGRHERNNYRRHQLEEITGKLKLRVPPFQGKMDPDAYLDGKRRSNIFSSVKTTLKNVK